MVNRVSLLSRDENKAYERMEVRGIKDYPLQTPELKNMLMPREEKCSR